ncbi:MAG: hypothetical protein ACR2IV_14110 [Bryobacteraceae bacterium]
MENLPGARRANIVQSRRRRVWGQIAVVLVAGNLLALTTKAAPSPDAQAAIEADTLVATEATIVDETTRAQEAQPESAPEPDLPQPALEGIVGQAESATPRRLQYHVSLAVRSVYDDNINLNPSNREDDIYTTIEPTFDVGFGQADGNYIALTYAPNAFLFVNHSENDALQHVISLTGQYRFPLLTLSLAQGVQILNGTGLNADTGTGTTFTRTNLDVAGRTRVNIYSTRLNANYSLTGKTFLTAGLGYSLSDYATFISSSVLSGNVYFNYTYSPKLSVGLGLDGGYNAVESGQDQTYEQINARASYELTGKVSASLTAGAEFRQATNSGAQDNGSPVFDGNLFYQPFDGTNISLSFARRTQNSATLFGQDFHSTSFTLSARQRFLQRIYLGLTVGYENSEYFSTFSGLSSLRSDDYYFLQPSVDLNITSFWNAGVYYFHREDDSTLPTFSFYDNQFGIRTSLTF